ncbi:MauE/DoxX family redox-associated membrane protein [Microbacterium testaceum]|uniref:MauE/DoxX family redox-associated membrane protein n=1 Tax=Microbacterium testaceum TaxID=2033 RepID=UPI002AC78C05|nr:MauE/DoxX family redox-associated membrane protein [Microbacterium testaceum]MDZ5146139.1 hypothetical protein [Microbacterium testaceum]
MDAAYYVLTLVMAPFLLVSGAGKLADIQRAPRTLVALRVRLPWPTMLVSLVSTGEIGLALALVVFDGWPRVLAALLTALMMYALLVLVRRAVGKGSTEDCGCFGRLAATPLSAAAVERNLVLAVLSTLLLVAAVAAGASPSLLRVGFHHPAAIVLQLVVGFGLVWVGAVVLGSRDPKRQARSALRTFPRPALLREDGLVVDVVQLALQGRAQLLLFSQPLCGACEHAQAVLDANLPALSRSVDARIVYAVGHGVDWNAPARSADGPRTPSALDVAGLLAEALDIASSRPVAVLLGTDGQPVLPHAHGAEEAEGLVEAIIAAGSASHPLTA